MRLKEYLSDETWLKERQTNPTKQQKAVLDKMIRNTKERVITSFMKGKNVFVRTEKDEYNITPDGKIVGGAFTKGKGYSGQ